MIDDVMWVECEDWEPGETPKVTNGFGKVFKLQILIAGEWVDPAVEEIGE